MRNLDCGMRNDEILNLKFLPIACTDECGELRRELAGGAAAVAERGFHVVAQLAERLVILGHFEQRVVAETGCADALASNSTADRWPRSRRERCPSGRRASCGRRNGQTAGQAIAAFRRRA